MNRSRLRRVRRTTVVKELSALRRFLHWCQLRGYLVDVPTIPSPPRTATGVDYDHGKRNKVRVELTEEEAEAILGNLPETMRGGGNPKAFFTVMYETTLRRGTLAGLMAPLDYAPGRPTLNVRTEIDKARFGRELPLSERARRALDMVCPDAGLIFGDVKYRSRLKAAALAAGLSEERAHHLSYHDWRHASLTHMASRTTDLVGLAYRPVTRT